MVKTFSKAAAERLRLIKRELRLTPSPLRLEKNLKNQSNSVVVGFPKGKFAKLIVVFDLLVKGRPPSDPPTQFERPKQLESPYLTYLPSSWVGSTFPIDMHT